MDESYSGPSFSIKFLHVYKEQDKKLILVYLVVAMIIGNIKTTLQNFIS